MIADGDLVPLWPSSVGSRRLLRRPTGFEGGGDTFWREEQAFFLGMANVAYLMGQREASLEFVRASKAAAVPSD